MSVAFTREEDVEAAAAFLPDRPVSLHPNIVTPAGFAAIEAELASARAAHKAAQNAGDVRTDRSAIAIATRDLRYWAARRASAQIVQVRPELDAVQFGGSVTFDREDGRRQRFRIVGEDEADAAKGSVSHVSPLARALVGKRVGDVASFGGHEVEVIEVSTK